MKEKIKILVSYHKNDEVIKSSIMTPIEVGAALHTDNLGILMDNTGENISEKNPRLCELTAQYWAWKNLDADYYGFMHYRRHFLFMENSYSPDATGIVFFSKIDDDYKKQAGLDDSTIETVVKEYDLIVTLPVDVSCWGTATNEIQFSSLGNLHADDFNTVCQTVCELFPDYREDVTAFRNGHICYWFNMFVMRKDLFYEYCEWLFSIIEEADRRLCYDGYDQQEMRTLAFMAERLFTIWVIHKRRVVEGLRVKELPISFIQDTVGSQRGDNLRGSEMQNDRQRFTTMITGVNKACEEMMNVGVADNTYRFLENEKNGFQPNKQMLFYGAGDNSKLLLQIMDHLGWKKPVGIWDKNAGNIEGINGIGIELPWTNDLSSKNTLVVITILNKNISKQIKEEFVKRGYTNIVEYPDFMQVVSRILWKKEYERKKAN